MQVSATTMTAPSASVSWPIARSSQNAAWRKPECSRDARGDTRGSEAPTLMAADSCQRMLSCASIVGAGWGMRTFIWMRVRERLADEHGKWRLRAGEVMRERLLCRIDRIPPDSQAVVAFFR